MEYKIGDFTCSELKEKYGTPLYVYDEALMRSIIRDYKNNLKSDKFKTLVLYFSFNSLHVKSPILYSIKTSNIKNKRRPIGAYNNKIIIIN